MSPIRPIFLSVALLACFAAHPLADEAPTNQDAFIRHDPASQAWTIGNSHIAFVVGFNAADVLTAQQLWDPVSGSTLAIDAASDTTVTLAGQETALSGSGGALKFLGATADTTAAGVQLTFTFEHTTLHAIVKRIYACYPGSPTIEAWTRLEAQSNAQPIAVSNLVGWQLTMPAAPVRWVNGLRTDSAADSTPNPDTFTTGGGVLDDGKETDIGAAGRSSEAFVPFVSLDDGNEVFYGGVIWSGAWRIAMLRTGDRVTVRALFPGIVTMLSVDHPIEIPHAFFGYTDDSSDSQTSALRQFALNGIRQGRPLQPLVTYNTWFPYGTAITEADVDEEMRQEAALGAELFVLDAGWYEGAGANGPGDFSSGLGSWKPDPDRFPSQLVGLSDEAHALGMKFGLWVEPERVALDMVNQAGLAQEPWLATVDGSYNSDGRTAQLCLGSPAARKWVLSKLVQLIDTVKPDYLKWDNNFWINCNRLGHGHGANDGNFAHVLGLYTLLDELRHLYPDLVIENVSGGGNRLDYGMMAYTDAGWMDDLTHPSSHVRHNLEGLSSVFPPAYLLSFVIDSDEEPLGGPDLANVVRSRGLGVLGVTWRSTDLDDNLRFGLAREIARYKLLRGTITQSAATLLGNQAPFDQDGWDILLEVAADQRTAIVFAFKADDSDGRLVVRPQNLLPGATYDVSSEDNGALGSATGADLTADGIELVHVAGAGSRAHLLVLTAE